MLNKIVWGVLIVYCTSFYAPAFSQSNSSSAVSNDFVGEPIVESSYKLGPGDQVAVNLIVGDHDMSVDNVFMIGPDGKIFFPKVGEINLLGLTIPEAKKKVDASIREVYKEEFTLSFRLVQPRKVQLYLSGDETQPLYSVEKKFVSVYGEVMRAGRYEYIPGKNFSDYVSYAGGPTPRANLSWSSVSRENKRYGIDGAAVIFNGDVSHDIEILPGDVINVPAQFFYFTDFGSFSNMILTFVALYNTFIKK